jgi:DNA/RNA-binding domain of Phe-tRNA-synthetase-like protein
VTGSLTPCAGFIAAEVRAEFPDLGLAWLAIAARVRRSPPGLVAHLAQLSDRFGGARAVTLRTRPVPQAFRAFFRQIGLDPDVDRPPLEQAALLRLMHGAFRSSDVVTDARLTAMIETGVPVWALDAAAVDDGGPGIRAVTAEDARASEWALPAGTLAVADARRAHSVLFAEPRGASAVSRATRRVVLFAVRVPGVPELHVEEALWQCAELIGGAGSGC